MDDGGKLDYTLNKGKGIVFNTHSFMEEEVKQMCIELQEKFKLNPFRVYQNDLWSVIKL